MTGYITVTECKTKYPIVTASDSVKYKQVKPAPATAPVSCQAPRPMAVTPPSAASGNNSNTPHTDAPIAHTDYPGDLVIAATLSHSDPEWCSLET